MNALYNVACAGFGARRSQLPEAGWAKARTAEPVIEPLASIAPCPTGAPPILRAWQMDKVGGLAKPVWLR